VDAERWFAESHVHNRTLLPCRREAELLTS